MIGAGSHSFTNSGHINTIFSLSGGGSDSVQNSGTINPGIQKSGSGSTIIATNLFATALEFSGGVSASLGSWADLYAKVSYTTGIDANSQSALSGRLGFRVIW